MTLFFWWENIVLATAIALVVSAWRIHVDVGRRERAAKERERAAKEHLAKSREILDNAKDIGALCGTLIEAAAELDAAIRIGAAPGVVARAIERVRVAVGGAGSIEHVRH